MSNLISVNADSLKKYGKALREADPVVKARLAASLRDVAAAAAEQARGLASWSTRIPATVRPGGTGMRAYVRAGGAKAPHAPAFEHHGQGGTFRHPVFGNRENWVDQGARPFLSPAVDRSVDEERIAAAIVRRIEEL